MESAIPPFGSYEADSGPTTADCEIRARKSHDFHQEEASRQGQGGRSAQAGQKQARLGKCPSGVHISDPGLLVFGSSKGGNAHSCQASDAANKAPARRGEGCAHASWLLRSIHGAGARWRRVWAGAGRDNWAAETNPADGGHATLRVHGGAAHDGH
eukprot:2250164-Pleurochrysis_carterae.AAC.1